MIDSEIRYTPAEDDSDYQIAPEHYMWLNVIYTYFEDIKRFARESKKHKREKSWSYLRDLACHQHTRYVCTIVEMDYHWFVEQLDRRISEVENNWATIGRAYHKETKLRLPGR